jgi:hypothetical protein
MSPVFARVIWNYTDGKPKQDDVWFFATSFADAAQQIEEQFGLDLLGFSIYLFEENHFLFQADMAEMEAEAKTALGL